MPTTLLPRFVLPKQVISTLSSLIISFNEDNFIFIDLPDALLFVPAFPIKALKMQKQLMLSCYFHDKQCACNSMLFLFEQENTGLTKIYNLFTIAM